MTYTRYLESPPPPQPDDPEERFKEAASLRSAARKQLDEISDSTLFAREAAELRFVIWIADQLIASAMDDAADQR